MEFGYFTLGENNTCTSNQLASDSTDPRQNRRATPLGSANITSIRLAFSPALKLYCPTSRRARETSDSHRPCNDRKVPLWRCAGETPSRAEEPNHESS